MTDNFIIEKHFRRIKLVIKEIIFVLRVKKNFYSLDVITVLIYVRIQEKIKIAFLYLSLKIIIFSLLQSI